MAAMEGKILHFKPPQFPELRFEWHPVSKQVYLIRTGVLPEVGEIMAYEIENHGAAQNAVLIWLRGYQEGRTPVLGTRLN